MSRDFMSLNEEYRMMYEISINNMIMAIIDDNRFNESIRNLCSEAIKNNWTLEKKINILNIITK